MRYTRGAYHEKLNLKKISKMIPPENALYCFYQDKWDPEDITTVECDTTGGHQKKFQLKITIISFNRK